MKLTKEQIYKIINDAPQGAGYVVIDGQFECIKDLINGL
jgi:hypothetical protein